MLYCVLMQAAMAATALVGYAEVRGVLWVGWALRLGLLEGLLGGHDSSQSAIRTKLLV